ncbi:pyridoxamine 5'-phosphate oxidase family protein [Anoxynatronum sibiricum]
MNQQLHETKIKGLNRHRVVKPFSELLTCSINDNNEKEAVNMNHWETKREAVEKLMQDATVVRLALCDGEQPYVVPVNFGVGEGKLYFHSGAKGTKVDILSRNPRVAFEMDADVTVVRHPEACHWSMKYRSLVGTGIARLLTDPAEKKAGLDRLMAHHAPGEAFPYDEKMMTVTHVYEIAVEHLHYKEAKGS